MTGAAEQIANVAENVIAQAEERREIAEETAQQITDAVMRDKLSLRIDDCEEGIGECQETCEENANEIQNLETLLRLQAAEVSSLRELQATMQETILVLQSSLIPPALTEDQRRQSGQPRLPGTPEPSEQIPSIQPPENPAEEGPPVPEESAPPRRRGRLV